MTKWLPIKGFEDRYLISDDGRVKVLGAQGRGRFNADHVLKIGRTPSGYYQVALYPGGGAHAVVRRVSQLVLEHFVSPRQTGAFARHLDDDRSNNHVENLAWGTRSDNSYDAVRNHRHNNATKTHCKHGHPFSGNNLGKSERGRYCKECARQRNRVYQAKRKTARWLDRHPAGQQAA